MPLFRRADPVLQFALAVLVLLPFYLFIWFIAAPLLNWPPALAADALLPAVLPDTFIEVQPAGRALDVATRLPLPAEALAQLPAGVDGDLVFTINPLIYGYGLPFFTALAIAVPGAEGANWRRWLLGLPWLLVAQAWGVSFEALKSVTFDFAATTPGVQGFAEWQRAAIALGYQFGSLMLPSVLPVVLWMVLFRDFLATLITRPPAADG